MKYWKEGFLLALGLALPCFGWYVKKMDAKVENQGVEIVTVRLAAAKIERGYDDMKDDIKEIKDDMKSLLRRLR